MDTPGGLVDASIDIKNTIIKSKLPTYTYIDGQAISTGSLIALSSEKIAMRAGSTMGAAEPRIGSEIADEKNSFCLKRRAGICSRNIWKRSRNSQGFCGQRNGN